MTAISQQLTINDWSRGWVAKPEPWEIPLNALGYAQNVNLRNGRIEPITGLGASVPAASGKGPYRFLFKITQAVEPEVGPVDHEYWLVGDEPGFGVNVNRYVAELDLWIDQALVLPAFQDDTLPVFLVITYDGAIEDAVVVPAGVPVPDGAPSVGEGSGTGITGNDITYVYTWVDKLGYESAPSPPSNLITLSDKDANIQVYPPDDPGDWFGGYKLYRNVNGTYLLVNDWDDPGAAPYTYTDSKPNNQLGGPLMTANHAPAPPLHGLAFGSYAGEYGGFHGSIFYRTVPGQPDNWLVDEGVNVDSRITAAIGTEFGWLVLTETKGVLITGSGLATTVNKDYMPYGCPLGATWTCAKTNIGWVWWSRQGLVAWNGATFSLLTKGAFSDEQVALLQPDGSDPAALKAAFVDGEYRLFHGCGCLRVDLRESVPVFTTACITADALHVDDTGVLYVADDDRDDVRPWAGGGPMQIVVQTGELVAPSESDRFHVHGARIRYSGGVLRAQWYQGETPHGPELDVPANGLLWCPRGAWDRTSLELWGTATIHTITINPFSEAAP